MVVELHVCVCRGGNNSQRCTANSKLPGGRLETQRRTAGKVVAKREPEGKILSPLEEIIYS